MYPTTDFAVVPWYVVYTIFVDSFFNHSIECLTSLALACHKFIVLTSLCFSWYGSTILTIFLDSAMATSPNAFKTTIHSFTMRALFFRFRSGSSTMNASPFPDSVST